jgi:hypothetical protein
MLNGQFMQDQAQAMADRLRKDHPDDVEAQVRRAIRLTTGRMPAADEVGKDIDFIQHLSNQQKLPPEQALRQYCLLALNANEFVYVD